jgi:hypothetical protein
MALDDSLRRRADHWRNVTADDYQIATPVMVGLREVRESIAEVLAAADDEPTLQIEENPSAEPPRDIYNPRYKL